MSSTVFKKDNYIFRTRKPKKRGRKKGYRKSKHNEEMSKEHTKIITNEEKINNVKYNCYVKIEDFRKTSVNNKMENPTFVSLSEFTEDENNHTINTNEDDRIVECSLTDTDPLECDTDKEELITQKTNSSSVSEDSILIKSFAMTEVERQNITKYSEGCLIELVNLYRNISLNQTIQGGQFYVKCLACSAIFTKSRSFKKHILLHVKICNDSRQIFCKYCDYAVASMDNMLGHLKRHDDQCEVCFIKLNNKVAFNSHWKINKKSFKYSIDKFNFYKCNSCNLKFDLFHQIQKHWFQHSCKIKKIYQCQTCDAFFDSEDNMLIHRCLSCPICQKIFTTVPLLKCHTKHMKHYLECSTCSYEFILTVDYEKHMSLHSKTFKPHEDFDYCLVSEDDKCNQCGICGRIYTMLELLVNHVKRDHLTTDIFETDGQLDVVSNMEVAELLKTEIKCEVDIEDILIMGDGKSEYVLNY